MAKIGGVSGNSLKRFIERVETLEAEKKALTTDIKEVYVEAKSAGFNVKVMREIVKLRKMDNEDRHDLEVTMDLYKENLGMVLQADMFEDDDDEEKADAKPAKKKLDIVQKPTAETAH